jgi:pyruvate formate lyase activating enzyme
MRFGLQKLTLLDFPGEVACTVFTCGCNFRCPFCHNASLVNGSGSDLLDADGILAFLRKRAGVLDGVCLTGGEPLLHDNILDFAAKIKSLGYKLKLDTNGSRPEQLRHAIESGLIDYVAMDIKNSPAKYAVTCGNADALNAVKVSVDLLKSRTIPYEFRTTVTSNLHATADFTAIGKWLEGCNKYFLQPFLESDDILIPSDAYPVSEAQLNDFLTEVRKFIPDAAIRGR